MGFVDRRRFLAGTAALIGGAALAPIGRLAGVPPVQRYLRVQLSGSGGAGRGGDLPSPHPFRVRFSPGQAADASDAQTSREP
ncbi:MAG: twin-arginine translocation signal domain-containing protein [Acidobacteria bacterium]|nr:twin-arginine translocation signal domain-containing protein [Acidobacteriota bacterium]